MRYTLHTDGGARGNPGPAAIGGVIHDAHGQVIEEYGVRIGETTNNQAEYQSLRHGLERAKDLGIRDLSCYLDSELIVKQVNGEYRVKDPQLRTHYERVKELSRAFETIKFEHVARRFNERADALVNSALDAQ